MNGAFVTGGKIEDGEKRLTLSTVHIVGFLSTFIPHLFQVYTAGVVIGFAVVGAVKSFTFKKFCVVLHRFRFFIAAAHLLISIGTGMYPSNDGIPCGGTNRRVGICIGITKSFRCQPIEVWGGGK